MEALRISTASSQYRSASFPCEKTLQAPSSTTLSSPFKTQLRVHLSRTLPRHNRSLVFASLSQKPSDVDDAGKRTVASEKAVEGESQQLHETARAVSHDGGGKQVKRVEAEADKASEEATDQAAAEPSSSKSGNVGGGQEEGLSGAKKMTPKPDH
ncbi:hypothetical protein L7F22_060772 [Adiantum nelumboides]|nr:hypothetical protein [Adiantum nelumboides]